MDQILLCTNHIPLTTLIHNTFIENYMLEANGDYVKVYLYLAKCIQHQENGLSISTLADHMDNTEKDIIRALQYWEKRKLLQINRDPQTNNIAGIDMLVPESTDDSVAYSMPNTPTDTSDNTGIIQTAFDAGTTEIHTDFQDNTLTTYAETGGRWPESQLKTVTTSFVSHPMMNHMAASKPSQMLSETNVVSITEGSRERFSATLAEQKPQAPEPVTHTRDTSREMSVSGSMLQALADNDEFIWTCHVIESYLDRPMKPNETRLISYLYGTLHFSKDLLLYLYEYCISLGKTNANYIQAVALSWNEQGVTTPEEAEKVSTAYNSAYNAVSKALALGRALASVEKKCVDRWQKNWQMDLSVILEACNRTILKVHKADFKYIEGILEHWQQDGVHTLQDVEKADQAYAQNVQQTKRATDIPMPGKSKNQFQNFQQRTASTQEVDDLERKLLMR